MSTHLLRWNLAHFTLTCQIHLLPETETTPNKGKHKPILIFPYLIQLMCILQTPFENNTEKKDVYKHVTRAAHFLYSIYPFGMFETRDILLNKSKLLLLPWMIYFIRHVMCYYIYYVSTHITEPSNSIIILHIRVIHIFDIYMIFELVCACVSRNC